MNSAIPSGYSLQDRQRLLATFLSGDTPHDHYLAQLAGTELMWFTTDVTGDFIYTGKAFISNFDLELDTSVKVSISFTGNGNITKQTVV
jgi:hypothetical protein